VLFDLQSPGRRRIIKVVYAMLAILLAVGLVGFGIGSDATGGISEIFGGGTADTGFEDEIEDAEKRAEEQPKNERAQLELVTLYIQQGNQQLEADEATGQASVTPDAEESYGKAADAWDAYLKLKPKKPDTGAALQLANVNFLIAQNASSGVDAQIAVENAAEVQQVAADADPSRGNLGNLALYLYFAGNFAAADAAAAKAVAATPKDDQAASRKQFDQIKQQAEAFAKQVKAEQKQGAAVEGQNPLGGASGGLGGGTTGGGALGTP
jgi:tetratricopeptide (TPR) repeat protein